jgi:hypothetical protein
MNFIRSVHHEKHMGCSLKKPKMDHRDGGDNKFT